MSNSSDRRLFLSLVVLLFFYGLAALFFLMQPGRWSPLYSVVIVVTGVVQALLPPMRIGRWHLSRLVSGPLLLIASVVIVELALPPWCDGSTVDEQAAPLIQQLEEYRRKHGHYPSTLEDAGITPPLLRCGRFRYGRSDPPNYGLSVGDYERDGFDAWWNSKTREWKTASQT